MNILAGYIWTENGWAYDPTALVEDYIQLPVGVCLEDAFKPSMHQIFDAAIKILEEKQFHPYNQIILAAVLLAIRLADDQRVATPGGMSNEYAIIFGVMAR